MNALEPDYTQLQTRIDDLTDLAEAIPDEAAAAKVKRAANLLEDVKADLTAQSVAEAVTSACHQNGLVGPVGTRVLREKKRLLAA